VPADPALRSQCTTSNHTKEDVQKFAKLGQHVKEFVEKRTVHYKWYVDSLIYLSDIYPSIYLLSISSTHPANRPFVLLTKSGYEATSSSYTKYPNLQPAKF